MSPRPVEDSPAKPGFYRGFPEIPRRRTEDSPAKPFTNLNKILLDFLRINEYILDVMLIKPLFVMNNFDEIYSIAHEAGMRAGHEHQPNPMVVGHPTSLLGNDIDYSRPVEVIDDGVCGFASIQIKPATHKFSRWLKQRGVARSDSYYGGIRIWVGAFGQSYERKVKYANAFVKVVREYFPNEFKSVWVNSRLD